MSTAAPAVNHETEILRHHAGMTSYVIRANVEGLTHADSVAPPQPGGNSANWVLGHLVCLYNNFIPLLGQQPAMDKAVLARYDRGSAPLDPAHALPLDELRGAWDTLAGRVDAGLAALDTDTLDRPAPFSPSGNPNETVRSLVTTVLFHQASHAGPLGSLRRLAGKDGAIR